MIFLFVLFGMEFKFLGARAVSMGGAYTAIAEGPYGVYWNPAGIVYETGVEFGVGIQASANATKNILGDVDDLTNLSNEIQKIQGYTGSSTFTLDNYRYLIAGMKELNDLNEKGKGVIGGASGGFYGRVSKINLMLYSIFDVGANPFFDLENLRLVPQGSTDTFEGYQVGYSTSQIPAGVEPQKVDSAAQAVQKLADLYGLNLSGTDAKGALIAVINASTASGVTTTDINTALDTIINNYNAVKDFLPSQSGKSISENESSLNISGAQSIIGSIAYGKRINNIALGVSLNLIKSQVVYKRLLLFKESEVDFGKIFDEFNKNLLSSSVNIDFDIGMIYEISNNLRAGVVLKNLFNPSFSGPADAPSYSLGRKLRAGLYYKPLSWIGVSSDLDLTRNDTILSGYRSQIFSLGSEINIFGRRYLNFGLRAGVFKNIAEDEGLNYTAGLGLRLGFLFIDAGGFLSDKKVRAAEGNEIPQHAGFNLALGLRF